MINDIERLESEIKKVKGLVILLLVIFGVFMLLMEFGYYKIKIIFP